MLNPVQQDRAKALLGHLDDTEEMLDGNDELDADIPSLADVANDEHHLIEVYVPRRRRRPYIARVARELKLEFRTPERTVANLLTVRRKACSIM